MASSFKKILGVNTTAEVEGVWHDLAEGVRIKVARAGNPRAEELSVKKILAAREQGGGSISPEQLKRIGREVMAEAILVDWSGVTDEAGIPVPYSKEKALEFLSDPELHDLEKTVDQLSGQRRHYALKVEEAARGN
jgi:hypothetical protein